MIRKIRIQTTCLFIIVLVFYAMSSRRAAAQSPDLREEAYEHNRQGMIAMSTADFEAAITEFQKAAAVAGDYQITGKSLIYTPVFMTAWAHEKIGRIPDACREFQRFLAVAPPAALEETKAEHAREYLKQHCR